MKSHFYKGYDYSEFKVAVINNSTLSAGIEDMDDDLLYRAHNELGEFSFFELDLTNVIDDDVNRRRFNERLKQSMDPKDRREFMELLQHIRQDGFDAVHVYD